MKSVMRKNIEDIYIFEVNTKYISSNVLKISVISRVRRKNKIADICNTFDELFLVFTEKNVVVFCTFCLKGKNLTFYIVIAR